MFDIGWSELLIIGVVALIVIGPKDLPEMFRTLGRFTAKARTMSRDFQRAMEVAAKESGVSDIARDVKNVASPRNLGLDAVRNAADKFEKWDPLKPAPTPAPARAVAPVAGLSPAVPAPAATPATAPMGPATAALAEAKAKERVAALGTVENRSAAPVVSEAAATVLDRAPKARKSVALKSVALKPSAPAKPAPTKPVAAKPAPTKPAPTKPAKAKAKSRADAAPKARKARKTTPESPDA